MVDPCVRGERFSGGTGNGGKPKMNQSAKLINPYITDNGVVAMNMYPESVQKSFHCSSYFPCAVSVLCKELLKKEKQ